MVVGGLGKIFFIDTISFWWLKEIEPPFFCIFCFVYIEMRGQPSPRVSSSGKLDVIRLIKNS